jgi:hypothetical protein
MGDRMDEWELSLENWDNNDYQVGKARGKSYTGLNREEEGSQPHF